MTVNTIYNTCINTTKITIITHYYYTAALSICIRFRDVLVRIFLLFYNEYTYYDFPTADYIYSVVIPRYNNRYPGIGIIAGGRDISYEYVVHCELDTYAGFFSNTL